MAVEEQRQRENPSMEKKDSAEKKKDSPAESAAWGTWEELLLAYAVNRYGTKSWDSIASELRKRSSAPILLTPHHCRQKYQELKRRFSGSDVGEDGDGSETATTAIPWLDELRNLRVAELQRQLQNYDLSIASLQLKVKRLTEESEKKSDLGQKTDETEIKNEEEEDEDNKNSREPKKERPEPVVSGEVPLRGGEESDRDENQSVNGSNGNLETCAEKSENENENEGSPVRTGNDKPESGAVLPVREDDSCNVRPDERTGKEPSKVEPDGEASESPGSMAESKSGEGTTKENSDVQSSASKSRKERRDKVRRGSSRVDERENEDLSKDSIPVRSLPLVDFLHKLQKLGSAVFERRLDRQEKLRYKKLIRQHIDFEILQTRLKSGWYSDGNDKFFRDLLLLVNNTCIFFPKDSSEAVAASEIRQLVLKEMMAKRKPKTDSKATEKQSSSKPSTLPSKRASEPPDSLLLKPKLAGPMIVCRKRSSITAKASGSSSGADRRKEQTDMKNSDKLSEENQVTTKRTRDAFPLVPKRNGKNVRTNSTSETHSNQDRGKAASPSETSDSKSERRKKKPSEAEEKKQSAAKFLNRMKRSSSSSNNEPLLNTLKGSVAGGSSENDSRSGGGEQKRGGSSNRSGDSKKDQLPKRNSGGRQPKEQSSPAKRAVGRPPKRAAAPPPMSAALGKRNREPAETETSASKQTKKRSRR